MQFHSRRQDAVRFFWWLPSVARKGRGSSLWTHLRSLGPQRGIHWLIKRAGGLFGRLLDLARGKLIEVRFDVIQMHDVDIFMMQVEKVGLVNKVRAVERALFDDRNVKPI